MVKKDKKTKKQEWKVETFTKFKRHFDTFIKDTIKKNKQYMDEKGFLFIPISKIVIEMTGVWKPHWRRELNTKNVKHGDQKLKLILDYNADQELIIANSLMCNDDGKYMFGLTKILDTYFGVQNTSQDFSLDEAETTKDLITISIGKDTGKLNVD